MFLILVLASSVWGVEIADLRVPLAINSKFVVRTDEGPPSNRTGISRYAPSYLFKFTVLQYKRDITFSERGDYIYLRDYYGDYQLPSFQAQNLGNFVDFRSRYALNNSWRSDLKSGLGKETEGEDKSAVQIDIPWDPPRIVERFIGEGKSNIKVTGTRSISFSGRSEWEDNFVNTGTFKQSKFPTLQMEQKSRFKVTGTVGSKITVEVDQDSQRDVELANTIKLRYKGDEDEILQSIEAGNTNLSLPNAQLIGFSQNVQGLFGIKATAKVGNLDLTMITSQEKGSSEKTTFNAGAAERSRPIRDFEYLANTYFWLDVANVTQNDSLLKVELFVPGSDANRDPWGYAVVNPEGQLPYISPEENTRNEFEIRRFAPYESGDPTQFELNKTNWYIVLNKPLQSEQVLAAYVEYLRYHPESPGIVDTVRIGTLNYGRQDTALVLQLLKASGSNPGFTTWNRMWRNVYDLGSRNISPEGFELKIFKGNGGAGGQITDPEDQDGQCFITILGLDRKNNTSQEPTPDCLFDFDNTMIDSYRGHLIFPDQKPFVNANLQDTVPDIYNRAIEQSHFNTVTKYYINVKSAQRSNSFSLGRANIMPNSEVVKLGDGTVLRRDIDYTINYDIGQISFLSEQALSPAANVTVDFEYAPFFMPEKKSLFGMAAQYKLFENSNISMAAMYRSETASEPRPRVGREPRRGFVWDSNFSFNFKPEIMTDLVNALPLVEADAPSDLTITGEVAQSFPNPNLKNEAFIDDFEGSRNYTDLSTRRGIWTASSPPLDSLNGKLNIANRGKLWWYNPFQPLRITDIWPERDIREQENRIDVLFLKYFPDTNSPTPESSWAGIMRPFYSGLSNQTLSKFIEIWYFPDSSLTTDDAQLHINLGSISEDINDDGVKNTEDRLTTGAVGTFEPDLEDTGIDGLFDGAEPGYSNPGNTDPNGDNWAYDQNQPDDYSRINGTEGNKDDPDRRGRFDTEDINSNTNLDRQNGYFEYIVHLNNPEYLVDSTSKGWKLLRIPLQDSTIYDVRGNRDLIQDFSRIDYARLWFTGATTPRQIVIASIELVGNKWQEAGIINEVDSLDYLRPGEKFEVTIKNTQENANYYPPPGVEGNLNRETGIREKEQSLVLAYENMAPNHDGSANWNVYNPEDYTQYQRLKMYVYGDTAQASGIPDGKVMFYLRLSQDGINFYEYHSQLQPGWAEGNWVDIDFTRLTELKYELQRRTAPESLAFADTVEGNYRVHGNPSMSQVKWFMVGVKIASDAPETVSGEVWIDEMRVTEIRRKSDFAGRIQATARFSDFFDVTASYNRTGADFFPLSARVAAGATSVSKAARFNIKADKLLPPSLGLSLPVTVTWQNSLALPRLKPGSDIILQQEAREYEKTENSSYGYSVSQAFNRNTKNWLWNLTLNRIRTSYNFSRTEGISPTSPVNIRDTFKGTGSYDLTPKGKPVIKPFFWGKFLFLPEKLHNAQMAYLPTQLSLSGEVNGSKSTIVSQRGIATNTRVRDLSLTGNTAFSLFPSLRTSYSASSGRDISQPGRFKLSIDPSKLKLGQERSFTQRFETSFQPKIINFIDNRFTFNSNYSENSDFSRNPDSTRTTQMSGTFKTDLTFNIQNLFGSGGRNNRPAPRIPENRTEPGKEDPNLSRMPGEGGDELPDMGEVADDSSIVRDSSETGGGFSAPGWVWDRFAGLMRTIKPVRASFTKDRRLNIQGLIDRPSLAYVFGLSENHHAQIRNTTGISAPNQSVYSNTYDFDSGLQPFRGLDITTGYNLRKTITRSSNEPLLAKSVTFPEISVNISGLEKMALFKKISNTVGLQTSFSKKIDENGREDTGELYKRDTAKLWAPLAGINITFKNDVRASLRYDLSRAVSQNLKSQGQAKRDVYTSDNTIKMTLGYSLSAPQGLKLPLLKKVKFNSQLSLNLDVTVKNSKSESVTDGQRSTDSQRSQIIIEPRMTYQFSRAITGGIRGRWDDSDDKVQKRKHHIRELGITAEIRF